MNIFITPGTIQWLEFKNSIFRPCFAWNEM